ncbi:MAG: energy transducer TonB [Gammaproteobacteria bacterium]|nr:energy transducer TonB [Gammaproteobacteria bacterium]MBT8150884.1 energy transducer TonB [Gammaproteobacteria bacterium]NND40323.1 TonB family protein [Pseudomonadales bacterium]NNL11264.1 TonB family protein [Pseudomonadales bacterium]NNM11552.1 TonB family protein [Pseudomonadales bacterium]
MNQFLKSCVSVTHVFKLPAHTLALLLACAHAPASADHGPGIADSANADHTHSVTRSTSGDDITISLLPAKKGPSASPANSSKDFAAAQQSALLKIYRSNLLKKTYQHVVYPDSAISKNHEGEVVLMVTIDRKGKIRAIDYDTRARFNSLNKAASIAVKRAKPYPPVPAKLEGETFRISMPIRFRLQS